ncbi:MAG TPA: ubiquinol-cytochrome c reductase iron-sulfur subunit [Burkholderiales bacterium]|nr:ubiquinol-cytochrome c reductase iron-sulfur subunit [Burkholderiales bacterium]
MENSGPDLKRRRVLLAASGVLGAVAAVGAATPFFLSMLPSARARAAGAPVEVDLSKIEPGMLVRTEWRGMPVWVLHRTPEMLASLPKTDGIVADPHSEYPQQPDYCRNEDRSIRPEWFVVIAICTHLGCVPLPVLTVAELGPDWPGGFFCPCHGSKYDLAGRVFKDVPAPLNLVVPRYEFLSDTRLLIGADKLSS